MKKSPQVMAMLMGTHSRSVCAPQPQMLFLSAIFRCHSLLCMANIINSQHSFGMSTSNLHRGCCDGVSLWSHRWNGDYIAGW